MMNYPKKIKTKLVKYYFSMSFMENLRLKVYKKKTHYSNIGEYMKNNKNE